MSKANNERTVKANGSAVKELRRRRALTVRQFAKLAKLSKSSVEAVQRGENVYPFTLRKIATAFQVSLRSICLDDIDDEAVIHPQRSGEDTQTWIVANREYEKFSEGAELAKIMKDLEKILGTNKLLVVALWPSSSVSIVLQVTHEDALRLLDAFIDGELRPLGIIRLKMDVDIRNDGTVAVSQMIEASSGYFWIEGHKLREVKKARRRKRLGEP